MNKSESKYFNTACLMDEAFLLLLEKKDYEFITVKEICTKAGVNRSTFYLHYESIADLLEESVDYIMARFYEQMSSVNGIVDKIDELALSELYLITPQYLDAYLNFIKDNRRTFAALVKNHGLFRLDEVYGGMYKAALEPILNRFGVAAEDRKFLMAFYISGLTAIVNEWLRNDCADSVEKISELMRRCVKEYKE